MEDDSECYFWTFAAALSFCCLVSSLHASRVWNRLQYCTVDRRQAGDAGGAEFQSASPCEQRAASELWPLMPPGTAITCCAGWQTRHYISQDAICLFASDTCCSWETQLMIKLKLVTLRNKACHLLAILGLGENINSCMYGSFLLDNFKNWFFSSKIRTIPNHWRLGLHLHCCVLKLRRSLESKTLLVHTCGVSSAAALLSSQTTHISHDHSASHSTCSFKECFLFLLSSLWN